MPSRIRTVAIDEGFPWRRVLYLTGGMTALALACVGVVLPLLPSTCLLLVSAACFSRSSERIYRWLAGNRWWGPPIREFRETGSLSPVLVVMSLSAIWTSSLLSVLVLGSRPVAVGLILAGALAISVTLIRLGRRPRRSFPTP